MAASESRKWGPGCTSANAPLRSHSCLLRPRGLAGGLSLEVISEATVCLDFSHTNTCRRAHTHLSNMDGKCMFKKDTGHLFQFSHSFFHKLEWHCLNHRQLSLRNFWIQHISTISIPYSLPLPTRAHISPHSHKYTVAHSLLILLLKPLYTQLSDCFIELDIQKNRSSL